jgi:hypothetical protein
MGVSASQKSARANVDKAYLCLSERVSQWRINAANFMVSSTRVQQ